jgi:phosphoribosylpyrophosphate synthetase
MFGAEDSFCFVLVGLWDRVRNVWQQLKDGGGRYLKYDPTTPQSRSQREVDRAECTPLLAQAIFNIHAKKSISALFK